MLRFVFQRSLPKPSESSSIQLNENLDLDGPTYESEGEIGENFGNTDCEDQPCDNHWNEDESLATGLNNDNIENDEDDEPLDNLSSLLDEMIGNHETVGNNAADTVCHI